MWKQSTLLALVVLLIIAMGGWFLFTASISIHELILGAECVLLTLVVSALAWHRMRLRFSPTLRQAIALWRLPWYVLSDDWEMFLILMRDLSGRRAGSHYRAVPFHTAQGGTGVSQIILATAYTTVSPNSIVIGVSREKLLFHQVKRSGVPRLITDLEDPQ